MACPPPCGPFPLCGPIPLPGPCGPCGPCGPLYSGVGKCFPSGPVGCSAQELDIYPMTGSPTGTQMIYSNNTKGTTTVTSFVESGSAGNYTETITLNLANVAGACSVTGTLTVLYNLTFPAIGNRNYTATATIVPFATTATLAFTGLPATTNGSLSYLHLTYA
jgi:hypothetical protein